MKLAGSRTWIVGASTGIGAALATELADRGARVAISARREQALREVAGDRMVTAPADVTDAGSLRQATEAVLAALGGLDLVVLNAGYWQQMSARDFDPAEFRRHVEVNLLGMAEAIGCVLPVLRGQGSGSIVGVASVAGYRGLPGAEGYGATKAGQINLLESLRVGLRADGIAVQTVCPGFVRTEMTARNDFPMPFMISAEQAAVAIADGIEAGTAEIVFPRRMAVLMGIGRRLPNRLWDVALRPRRRG
jgi:NAD(P)-dependent dehydrogenase (short-subunit alcohol dehydrogenase family)